MNIASNACGVDEAGRGPWAGPVCAAAVILHPDRPIDGLADSKTISAGRREALAAIITERAKAHAWGWASVSEIDRLNIRQATHLAMRRAISALDTRPDSALIDGHEVPNALDCPAEAVVKGDQLIACISAASILAKTARDAWMRAAEADHPGYGFARHKGYGTAAHAAALAALGPSPIHRRTFAPVARLLEAARPCPSGSLAPGAPVTYPEGHE
ncbi:MAG: ribonuclease HII [Pseudomonadota bacterium]